MLFKKFALGVVVAATLAACSPSGTYYEKSPEDVLSAIEKQDMPYHMFGDTIAARSVTRPSDDVVVVALVDKMGAEQMRIVAQVSADGSGSRVITQAQDIHGKLGESNAESSLVGGMFQELAEEHVTAAIEGRPFDMLFATPSVAKAMIEANPEAREKLDQLNQSGQAMGEMQQKMYDKVKQREFADKYGEDWAESGSEKSDGWAE
ncbi:MAG: hypothetical protein AAGK17_05165 [Pseudomonadota bacterium]